MASFEHRKAEIRALFEAQKTNLKPWEWEPVAAKLEAYFPVRDAALTALIEVVADDGADQKRSVYESLLDDHCARIGQAVNAIIEGLEAPSDGVLSLREQLIVQEGLFLRSLDEPAPCVTRDMLVALEAHLATMMTDLDAKWSTLKDRGRRVVDTELEATKAMEALLNDAIRTSAPLYERVGAVLGQVIEDLAKIGDDVNTFIVQWAKDYAQRNPGSFVTEDSAKDATKISDIGAGLFAAAKALGVPAATVAKALPFLIRDPGMVLNNTLVRSLPKDAQTLLTLFGDARKALTYSLLSPYATRVNAVKEALPFQGVMIASLSETRADVARFMEGNGIDVARKLNDQSKAAFDTWVSSQPQAGNHDDAVDIRIAMEAPLQKRFDRLLSQLNTFVNNWGGIFFGTLNNDARRTLLDQEEWDRQMTSLQGLGLDERLKTWQATVLTIDPRLGDAWTQVQDAFAGLPVDVQYGLMQRLKAVWDPLVAQLREGAKGVTEDLERTAREAGEEQRRRDLDRSAALARLPA